MLHRVPYGGGDFTLRHYPPIRSATATYVIEDLFDSEGSEVSSGSATVDTASQTLDAAAGRLLADPRKIPLTLTSGITIGETYWLVSANGFGEAVTIAEVKTDDYVRTEDRLLGTYASSDTLLGLKMTATFPSAEANDENHMDGNTPFRAVWTYSINGVERSVQEQIRIVRNTHNDQDEAEALDLFVAMCPDIAGLVENSAHTLRRWTTLGARMLRNDLRRKDEDPELFLIGDNGTDALMWTIAEIAATNGYAPGGMTPQEFLEICAKKKDQIWESVTRGEAGKETVDLTRGSDRATDTQSRKSREWNIGL